MDPAWGSWSGEAPGNITSCFSSCFSPSRAPETRRREALLNGGRKSVSAGRQQPVHPKWVRGATAVKHYVFEVILRSFCALFKTLTSSYQSRRLPERRWNTNSSRVHSHSEGNGLILRSSAGANLSSIKGQLGVVCFAGKIELARCVRVKEK